MVDGQAEAGIGPAIASPRRGGAPARPRSAVAAARRLLHILPILPSLFAFLVLLYIILALESHGGEEHEAHPAASHAAPLEAAHAV